MAGGGQVELTDSNKIIFTSQELWLYFLCSEMTLLTGASWHIFHSPITVCLRLPLFFPPVLHEPANHRQLVQPGHVMGETQLLHFSNGMESEINISSWFFVFVFVFLVNLIAFDGQKLGLGMWEPEFAAVFEKRT